MHLLGKRTWNCLDARDSCSWKRSRTKDGLCRTRRQSGYSGDGRRRERSCLVYSRRSFDFGRCRGVFRGNGARFRFRIRYDRLAIIPMNTYFTYASSMKRSKVWRMNSVELAHDVDCTPAHPASGDDRSGKDTCEVTYQEL